MILYKKLNAAYDLWSQYPIDINLETLLTYTRQLVEYRYKKIDQAYEDIAQITTIRVWRALTGDLKPHDATVGDFSQYVVLQAVSSRKNFYKYDRLVPLEDEILEKLQYNQGFKHDTPQDPLTFEKGVEK